MTEYEQGYLQGLRDCFEMAERTARENVRHNLSTMLTNFIARFKKK
jgi:hypothetical protein